jgi:hypothetical protein
MKPEGLNQTPQPSTFTILDVDGYQFLYKDNDLVQEGTNLNALVIGRIFGVPITYVNLINHPRGDELYRKGPKTLENAFEIVFGINPDK